MSDAVFTPGTSPFRSKGNVYLGLLESADARVPGGRRAVLERLDDPELARFFGQTFLAASSYDLLPLISFGMLAAKICGVTYPEFVRGGAAFIAHRDMRGIYKVLLKLASPTAVVQRLPRILIQYFNFGHIEGRFTSERAYEATATKIPRPLVVWLLNVAHGFMPVVMSNAGARNPYLRVGPLALDGSTHGVALMHASFVVTWDAP